MKIRKRDNRIKEFDKSRIEVAVKNSYLDVFGNEEQFKLDYILLEPMIEKKIEGLEKELVDIEQIQEIIIECLEKLCKQVSKAYSEYREQRERVRVSRHYSNLKRNIIDVKSEENSNANVDENSFTGKELRILETITKQMALDILPYEVRKRHLNTLIYQHDLSKFILGVHNCLFPDYVKCLDKGFSTRQGDTKPAQKYLSACQLIPVILQLQSQIQFGGAGIANFSIHMTKYLKKSIADKCNEVIDIMELGLPKQSELTFKEARELLKNNYKKVEKLINKEVSQAHQALITNLVTLESRSGSQVPFTSINLGLIKEGCEEESAYIIRKFLEELENGVGKWDRTAIFPITIFQCKKGVNKLPSDPYFDLRMYAQRVANKRLYPTFSNLDWSQNKAKNYDEEVQIFGCRTLLTGNVKTGDYAKIGRGNLAPVTMNLPYLALYSNGDVETFFKNLDENLDLAMESLLLRQNIMYKQPPSVAPFMYNNGTILGAEKCVNTVEKALENCSLSIGYIGIAECTKALVGNYHHETKEARELGVKIVKRIREYCDSKKVELDINIGVYPTPSEGLCRTALNAIRRDFGDIEGITDNEYLTNSHHTRVEDGVNVFDKIDIESDYASLCNAGNIFHIEIDGVNYNEKAITKAIDAAMESDIPYVRLSHPIATCMECGYSMPKYMKPCEKCSSDSVENLAIVTGYLTTDISSMNTGKQDEVNKRKLNNLGDDI